ncbi:zf-CSL-domain-containing protein [Rickenella mellea]|uniref:Diphthamide biosynthesis protein 3 n=1 Tax=Rickenella mellea TaxID=50990 RepID=A0A4Y7PPX5_9AGAM|nr:zf-CSL-domain-containing protein [Rickenella mellea]
MGAYYDEIEIEDMTWDEEKGVYHYPCPCGDRFEITRRQLADCEDIATCPSCSLIIRVIYDPLDFEDEPPDEDEGEAASGDDDDEGDDTESNGSVDEKFEDAMENLNISDNAPLASSMAAVAVGA